MRGTSPTHPHKQSKAVKILIPRKSLSERTFTVLSMLLGPGVSIAICVIAVFSAVIMTFVSLFFQEGVPGAETFRVCHSAACKEYSALLNSSINSSVHPCNNFEAYVCTGVIERRQSVYQEHMRAYMEDLATSVRKIDAPNVGQSAVEKAARFFRSCETMGHNEHFIRYVLRQVGVTWPHLSKEADVLRTEIQLQLALGMSALVYIVRKVRRGNVTVFIQPAFNTGLLKRSINLWGEHYNSHVDAFMTHFTNETANSSDLHRLGRRACEKLCDLDTNGKWVETRSDKMALHTPAFPGARWRFFGVQYTVLISAEEYLKAWSDLVLSEGESAVHLLVGWIAVQQMVPFLDKDLAARVAGSVEEAQHQLVHRCLSVTASRMGWSLFAEFAWLKFHGRSHDDINKIISVVHGTLQPSSGSALDVQYLENYEDVVQSAVPDMGNDFSVNWIKSGTVSRMAEANLYLPSVVRTFYPALPPLDISGTSMLPPYVAMLPLYDVELPLSVKFGAFAYVMAMPLMESSQEVDSFHRSYAQWLCMKRESNVAWYAIRDLTLIPLLWKAFRRFSKHVDIRLIGMEGWSTHRTFLVSMCYLHCSASRRNASELFCNEIMRRTNLFADVFRCDKGSYMHPYLPCMQV